MIDPKVKQLLDQMAMTAHGKALKVYLDDQIKYHTDINKMASLDELLGAQIAVRIIRDVFKFLEIEKPTQPKEKNQYT